VLDLTQNILVLEPPEEVKNRIFKEIEESEKAKEEILVLLKKKGLEKVEHISSNFEIVLEEEPAEPLDPKLFIEKGRKRIKINRKTKAGREFALKMQKLLNKAGFSFIDILLLYAEPGKFGFLSVKIDRKLKLILFCGVYGVNEKKLLKDGWIRRRVFVEVDSLC